MKVFGWRAMALYLTFVFVLTGCTTTAVSNDLRITPDVEAPVMHFEDPAEEIPVQPVVETKVVVPVVVPKVVVPKTAVPLPVETVKPAESLQVIEPDPVPVVEKQETTPQPVPTPQPKTDPTPAPVPKTEPEPESVAPAPTTQFSCAVEKSCPKMVSCEEAYYHLNTCSFKKRDGDNDGVPCEDICPGG
jgi:hypothetical protein